MDRYNSYFLIFLVFEKYCGNYLLDQVTSMIFLARGLPPPAPSRNSLRSPACCPLHHLHHHHIAQLFGSLMKQLNFRGHETSSLALFCHAFIATPSSQGSSFSDLVRLVAKSRAQMSPPPLFASNISLLVSQLFFITSSQMLILFVLQLFLSLIFKC